MTSIPRIVLDDDVGGNDPGVMLPDAVVTCIPYLGPTLTSPLPSTSTVSPEPSPPVYVPHRCNSDIGLPTSSMPNLPLAMVLGGEQTGQSGDKLGVYCSPRTTRRSVDLDLASRHPATRADYEWLAEDKAASLRVLGAGSRVGSAVSLNSACTAHSVGLLSNDSSDDLPDNFLCQHERGSSGWGGSGGTARTRTGSAVAGVGGIGGGGCEDRERTGQLRRLQSYPETEEKGSGHDPASSGVTPRTSHSLCNLKAAQIQTSSSQPQEGNDRGHDGGHLTPEKLDLLPSDLEDGVIVVPAGEEDRGKDEAVVDSQKQADNSKASMVSYGKGSSSMRDGRIRRWLRDVDTVNE